MRPTEARIDLAALRSNYELARELAPSSKLVAIVKADAYGHGVHRCVEALSSLAAPPDALGVAMLEEAVEIRQTGSQLPVVLLEGVFEPAEIELLSQYRLEPVIASPEQVAWFLESPPSRPLRVWLKLDSGMHRLGLDTASFARAQAALSRSASVSELVLMTHFANADRIDGTDTQQQIETFDDAVEGRSDSQSLANSAALLTRPRTHRDWVRPGIMMYGVDPLERSVDASTRLQPVQRLVSRISSTREVPPGESIGYGSRFTTSERTRVGVVPVGYADGYPREAPDGTPVLVSGQRSRIIGLPSMDRITVDLTGIPDTAVGSPVELWGPNLPATEVARACGTIAYTLVTGVGGRVPRVYDE